jgi:hypothetical protein
MLNLLSGHKEYLMMMMRNIIYACIVLAVFSCREKYVPPFAAPGKGYLVVDGVINSGQGPTTIRLGRSVPLSDTSRARTETKAIVRVEGEDNSVYPLTEGTQGVYSTPQLGLNNNVKYRLYIKTTEGREYLSDFAKPIKTPPIDTIRWEQPSDLTLYINTHDPQNNIRYYRWEYDETWEFHSYYFTQLKYLKTPVGQPYAVDYIFPSMDFDYTISTCWQSESSAGLLIGSSAKLSRDSIDLPLRTIPRGSAKLSVLYTIKVRQNSVSKEGYEFLQRMKKNTESTGTLFDAQPSELVGNIHAKNDPTDLVLGFMEVADVQEKRIWINTSQLNQWGYTQACPLRIVDNHPDSIKLYSSLAPTTAADLTPQGAIVTFNATDYLCVDCRLRGTNVKPPFWP